jgi:metallo-beta-lactamase family protein
VQVVDFSVHADSGELVAWLGRAPKRPHTLYVVHGEPRSAAALARLVTETLHWNAVVPRYGERVRLDA